MNVDPLTLRPSYCTALNRRRLDFQRDLVRRGLSRHTPVYITIDGIIIDGHHGTRACAEAGRSVEIEIRETGPNFSLPPLAASILDLEVSVD